MKNRIHGMVAGFLIGILMTSTVVFATTGTRTLQATFRDIKLVVDGKAVTPKDGNGNVVEPFVVDGTTYLPVRAVGEALGKEVNWDGNTNTVTIGGSTPQATVPPAEQPQANTRTLLSSIQPFKSNYVSNWTENQSDNWGNKYVSGYYFTTNYSVPANATFILNSKYKKLTATITPAEGFGEMSNPTILRFYSLSEINTTKIFETKEITSLTKPYTITVDLQGVDTLMIEAVYGQSNEVYVSLVDAYLE